MYRYKKNLLVKASFHKNNRQKTTKPSPGAFFAPVPRMVYHRSMIHIFNIWA